MVDVFSREIDGVGAPQWKYRKKYPSSPAGTQNLLNWEVGQTLRNLPNLSNDWALGSRRVIETI